MDIELPTHQQSLASRFTLQEKLGEGGMGQVYRAQHHETGEICALKILKSHSQGDRWLQRFRREFRAASRLDHPSCVRAFELSESPDGVWYFTMELAPGGSLREARPKDLRESVCIALQVLAALDHMHSKGIIHRDVKPSNILRTLDSPRVEGSVKLTDLGIAQVGDLNEERTLGHFEGTCQFVSPEQSRGDVLDPRSDLYSLGIVLYFLLTGTGPFPRRAGRKSSEWIKLHQETAAREISEVAEVPAELADAVMRLLRKDPDHRYPSAAAVYDVFWDWHRRNTDEPVPPNPPLHRKGFIAAPKFVGREQDMAALLTHLHQSADPPPKLSEPIPPVFAVGGEAGVGKSRLLGQFVEVAGARGVDVRIFTCRAEVGRPFESVLELFDGILAVNSDDRHAAHQTVTAPTASSGGIGLRSTEVTLPDASARPDAVSTETSLDLAACTVTTVLTPPRDPAVGARHGTQQPIGPTKMAGQAYGIEGAFEQRRGEQWHFHRAVTERLLSAARQRHLVLVLEDAQWADLPTLDLMAFVATAVEAARSDGDDAKLMLLLSHRPAAPGSPLEAFLQEQEERGRLRPLVLRPLPAEAACKMVSSMLMQPQSEEVQRLAERLAQHTQGNPLYIGQVLSALLMHGHLVHDGANWNLGAPELLSVDLPPTLSDAIGDRAVRCSVTTKSILAACAVCGRSFPLSWIFEVAELDEPSFLDSLEQAMQAGFLEDVPGSYDSVRFVHDRFRDSIHAGLSEQSTSRWHHRFADLLLRGHAEDPYFAAEIARHTLGCGRLQQARVYLARAGDHAMSSYGFSAAADFYEQALALAKDRGAPPEPELLDKCGTARMQAGRYNAAAGDYEELVSITPDPGRRAEVLRKAAEVEFRRGNTDGGGRLLESVLPLVGFSVPGSRFGLHVRVVGHLLRTLIDFISFPVLRPTAVGEAAERLKIGVRVCNRLGERYYFSDLIPALYYQLTSFRHALRLGLSVELATATTQQAVGFAAFGYYGISDRLLELAQKCAEWTESPLEMAWLKHIEALCHGFAGRPRQHLQAMRRTEQLLFGCPEMLRIQQARTIKCEALIILEQLDEAEALAGEVARTAEELDEERSRGWGLYLRGHVCLLRAEHQRAISLLRAAMETSERAGDLTYQITAAGRLVSALTLAGQLEEAVQAGFKIANLLNARRVRTPSITVEGAFICAAACRAVGMTSRERRELRRKVRGVAKNGKHRARTMRYSSPLFLAGRGLWATVEGRSKRALHYLARMREHVDVHQLSGELTVVERLVAEHERIVARSRGPT